MAELTDGAWLQQYVAPQLLTDFRNYKDDFIAFLKKAPEQAIDKDGIRFNKLIEDVAFYINKSTAFTPRKLDEKKSLVEWDKMDTELTNVTDIDLRYMAYDKENAIRMAHTKGFKLGVRNYVMQKLAPAADVTGKMPVIRTTGDAVNGRLKLTYADLIKFYVQLETLNLDPTEQLLMVLCPEHRADLIEDRGSTNNYRDIEIDKNTGELKRFYKLKFFENNHSVKYDASGDLKAQGATPAGTDRNASVFFTPGQTVYHIERVKLLLQPMEQDTRSADPQTEFRTHTYGLCDKTQEHGFGALVSGVES